MIELDYLVLADYVRADSGVLHIMGAGIDTIYTPIVPAAHAIGIAARIKFDTTETPGTHHKISIVFQEEDRVLASVVGTFESPHQSAGVPVHWKTGINLALRATLPLPHFGDYSVDVCLDDTPVKSIDLRVIRPQDA